MRSYTVTRASMARLRRPSRVVSMGRSAALLVMAFVLLATQTGQGRVTTTNPLKFFKNYFVTGNHVVAGVGLKKAGMGGFVNDTITMRRCP